MDNLEFLYLMSLKPYDAIQYMTQKGYTFGWNWYQVWEEEHSKAFTVAKVMKLDILQDIREMVQQSLNDGITFDEFKRKLKPKLIDKGWWGKIGDVQLGSYHRLKTIYRTNLQVSYMAGKYKNFVNSTELFPYWQYDAILDKNTRPGHRVLDNLVFHYTDPFWNYFFPPNDWGCRCSVRKYTKSMVEERGLDVQDSKGKISFSMIPVGGSMKKVATYNHNGIIIKAGAGWSTNPGKNVFKPDLSKYDNDIRGLYDRD